MLGFPGGLAVKNLPAMQETQVQPLGLEDALEKWMAPHSSALAWRVLWTEEPGGLQSTGSQRVGHEWVTNTHAVYMLIPVSQFIAPSLSQLVTTNLFSTSVTLCILETSSSE